MDEVCSKVGHCTFEEKACAVTAGKIATSILLPPANVAIHFRAEHLSPHSIVDPSLDTSRDASTLRRCAGRHADLGDPSIILESYTLRVDMGGRDRNCGPELRSEVPMV